LTEQAVQGPPGCGQPFCRWVGQAIVVGEHVEVVDGGLDGRVAMKSPAASTWP
jgi:hypothetical protein